MSTEHQDESSSPTRGNHMKRNVAIVVIVALLLASGGATALLLWQRHRRTEASNACDTAVLTLGTDRHEMTLRMDGDAIQGLVATTADQVEDGATLDRLHAAHDKLTSSLKTTATCDTVSTDALRRSAAAASRQDRQLVDDMTAFITTATDVASSRIVKHRSQAQQVFDSSDGKVADAATRDGLKTAIADADTFTGKPTAVDITKWVDIDGQLSKTMQAVNDSVAKKTADDQAAEQQAQANATAAAEAAAASRQSSTGQTQRQSRGSSTSSQSSSKPRAYNQPRTSTAAPKAQSPAPAPQQNQSNNSSGDTTDWNAWAQNRQTPGCDSNTYCPIG